MTYNYDNYNQQQHQYNQTFENQANDRSSQIFWDAVSMTSSDRNSIALSVYHSVPELHYDENAASIRQRQNDKVKEKKFHQTKAKLTFDVVQTVSSCKKFFLSFAGYCLSANNNNTHFLFTSPFLSLTYRFGRIQNLLISFSPTMPTTGKKSSDKYSNGIY